MDSALPVIAISLAPWRLSSGTIASSSSLSPELESAMNTSSRVTMPEVAVARFGRMHEERGGAGAGERGGDLARDVARLADAAHDHAAAAREDRCAPLR